MYVCVCMHMCVFAYVVCARVCASKVCVYCVCTMLRMPSSLCNLMVRISAFSREWLVALSRAL